MLWILALAGITAAAVAAYNQLRRRDPAGADHLVQALREVSGIVVVVAQAVGTALDALTRPVRAYAAVGDPRYGWDWE